MPTHQKHDPYANWEDVEDDANVWVHGAGETATIGGREEWGEGLLLVCLDLRGRRPVLPRV